MHPLAYCSEGDHPKKVRVRPFKRDSKWLTGMQAPGQLYEALKAALVSGLITVVEPLCGCLQAFEYSHVSHLGISHFSYPVNLGEVNGLTW